MKRLFTALFMTVALPLSAHAQFGATTAIPAYKDPNAITLGTSKATGPENWENMGPHGRVVRNVTEATITPFLPDPAKATGASVVIAPGGAFMMLEMDNEGYNVAKWLADHGIAAFVLKYRLRPTSPDSAEFGKQLGAMMSGLKPGGKAPAMKAPSGTDPATQTAVTDGIAAVKYVREHAATFGVDPQRVGMVGFSAGAMTTLGTTLAPDASARPNFSGIIYGPMFKAEVPADAPPAFFAIAADDPLAGQGSGLVDAWREAKRPAELHVFERGGHGFGMTTQGATSDHWIDEFYWWIEARGLLKKQ